MHLQMDSSAMCEENFSVSYSDLQSIVFSVDGIIDTSKFHIKFNKEKLADLVMDNLKLNPEDKLKARNYVASQISIYQSSLVSEYIADLQSSILNESLILVSSVKNEHKEVEGINVKKRMNEDTEDRIGHSLIIENNTSMSFSEQYGSTSFTSQDETCVKIPDVVTKFTFTLSQEDFKKCYTGGKLMKSGWTEIFYREFQKINPYCVLYFETNWVNELKRKKFRHECGKKIKIQFMEGKARCQQEECLTVHFSIKDKPQPTADYVTVHVKCEGSYKHVPGIRHSRWIRGEESEHQINNLSSEKPRNVVLKNYDSIESHVVEQGNVTGLPSTNVLKKIKYEKKSENDYFKEEHDDLRELQYEFEADRDLLSTSELKGFIQCLWSKPLGVVLFCKKQLTAIKKMKISSQYVDLYIDPTGTVLKKHNTAQHDPYYYAVIAKTEDMHGIAVEEFILTDNSIPFIMSSLVLFKHHLQKVIKTRPIIRKCETDFNFALIQSCLQAFNGQDILSYLQLCYSAAKNKKNCMKSYTIHHICTSHVVKFVLRKLQEICGKHRKYTVKFAIVWFAHLQETIHLNKAGSFIYYGTVIFNNTHMNDSVLKALDAIGSFLSEKECMLPDFNTHSNSTKDDDVNERKLSQRKSSPFYSYFGRIIQKGLLTVSVGQQSSKKNPLYVPEFMIYMLDYLLPYYPLWSGLIIHEVCGVVSDTTSVVESHHKTIKDSEVEHETRLRWSRFIRLRKENVVRAMRYAMIDTTT